MLLTVGLAMAQENSNSSITGELSLPNPKVNVRIKKELVGDVVHPNSVDDDVVHCNNVEDDVVHPNSVEDDVVHPNSVDDDVVHPNSVEDHAVHPNNVDDCGAGDGPGEQNWQHHRGA
jgi:hypothetical protein